MVFCYLEVNIFLNAVSLFQRDLEVNNLPKCEYFPKCCVPVSFNLEVNNLPKCGVLIST